MHNHHDKIRERVAKLVRLARNNPSCAEAATAFALASELASKAGLDLDSIAADDAEAREDLQAASAGAWDRR